MSRTIRSVPELYAHALAIEREAAARYQEFARQMDDYDNTETAALFRQLAEYEGAHARELEQRVNGSSMPPLAPSEYSWLDDGPPESVDHALITHLMKPYHALKIALAAEYRARDFFDAVAAAAEAELRVLAEEMLELRTLAEEMSAEEDSHIAAIEKALAQQPKPHNWDDEDLLPFAMR